MTTFSDVVGLEDMSLAPYTFRPMTPPEVPAAGQHSSHVRNYSSSSNFSNISPESIGSTHSRSSVYRQHGPTLLPKIRTQDNNLQSSAGQTIKGHKRVLSNVSNASTYNHVRPQPVRCATEPVQDCITLMSPISNVSQSRASSIPPNVRSHSRSQSVCSLDESMLTRYGYPTYRQMPVYMTQEQHQQQQQPSPPMYPQSYMPFRGVPLMDPPSINIEGSFDMPLDIDAISRPNSVSPPRELQPSYYANTNHAVSYAAPVATTSLLNYLTQPTQPINLVRQLTFSTGRGLSSHFWWDVRNLRPWTTFSLDTMSQIPDLMTLLNFQHDNTTFPTNIPPFSGTATPSSEADLANLISKIYFPKVNAAACLSLGTNAPSLYLAPQQAAGSQQSTIAATAQPTFLANYPSENQFTLHGTPRGRVVGLSKSFDRWNTGMRHEGPAQKVAYLKGLSHLQKCMRDHSCRYGFIITEIELVCVRAGCDEYGQPYFGYLEVSEGIATKTSATSKVDGDGNYSEEVPLTASLALYFLLMLAKTVPLPGCMGSFMDVGGPGALTRQRILPEGKCDVVDGSVIERKADGRDKWMPDPQVGEKRDAKTARGWVMPADPWHKREGGRRSRRG